MAALIRFPEYVKPMNCGISFTGAVFLAGDAEAGIRFRRYRYHMKHTHTMELMCWEPECSPENAEKLLRNIDGIHEFGFTGADPEQEDDDGFLSDLELLELKFVLPEGEQIIYEGKELLKQAFDRSMRRKHVTWLDENCSQCGSRLNSFDKRLSKALAYKYACCERCIADEYGMETGSLRRHMERVFGIRPCIGI